MATRCTCAATKARTPHWRPDGDRPKAIQKDKLAFWRYVRDLTS